MNKKITTPYGQMSEKLLGQFCKISGYSYEPKMKNWTVLKEELDFWQLQNSSALTEGNKWKKKKGWLTVRDFNFAYCFYKEKGNFEKALNLAKETMFGFDGKPVYLPDELARQMGADIEKKPVSYNKILTRESEVFKEWEDQNRKPYVS